MIAAPATNGLSHTHANTFTSWRRFERHMNRTANIEKEGALSHVFWQNRRSVALITWLFLTVLQAFTPEVPATARQSPADARRAVTPGLKSAVPPSAYAGSEACRPCHAATVASYLTTAHQMTSGLATRETVKGRFDAGANTLRTSNPALSFRMEERPDGLYQVAMRTGATGAPVAFQAERIDIVTGSGRKGQTYLFWKGDRLFELPVSYWAALGSWVNSPGFQNGEANFSRVIPPRCLECHATAIETKPGTAASYERAGFIPGIGCEKCHGPARDHIAGHRSTPAGAAAPPALRGKPAKAPIARDVINTGRLSRERQIDLCATCHSGGTMSVAPEFSYVPGQPLGDYFARQPGATATSAEVHGNQVALLQNSKCYQATTSMTCSTCHDVHVPQRDVEALAARCQTCHRVEACRIFPKAGARIATRCIGCHMPNQQSGVITLTASNNSMKPSVRNHAIKVYPEESAAVLKALLAR